MDGARANFRIGEAFPSTDPRAGFVVRLAMAFHDMRVNYDLIARDEIKGPTRLWLVRLMVAQIREATVVVAPLTHTPILTLEDYLEPFEDDHPEDVREAREAAAELKSVIQAPWREAARFGKNSPASAMVSTTTGTTLTARSS